MSRGVAPSGSWPNSRRARRWRSRSQHWSSCSPMWRSRSASLAGSLPAAVRRCSSSTKVAMWSRMLLSLIGASMSDPASSTAAAPAPEAAPVAAGSPSTAASSASGSTPTAAGGTQTAAAGTSGGSGEAVYGQTCVACHGAGVAGAPKIGDKADWGPRIAQGKDTLYTHALQGFQGKKGVMPPKGGNTALPDADVKAAVDFMASKAQ